MNIKFEKEIHRLKQMIEQKEIIGLTDVTYAACEVQTIDESISFMDFLCTNIDRLAFDREDVSGDEFIQKLSSQLKIEKQNGWPELPDSKTDIGLFLAVFYIAIISN